MLKLFTNITIKTEYNTQAISTPRILIASFVVPFQSNGYLMISIDEN